ncbi:MAG: hypothetical protein K0S08_306 [Gammaproteobacteria bacterium]|jgi:hypothetical protein|nr:hypothetical protein [Gammaproteobacteria bacterium]
MLQLEPRDLFVLISFLLYLLLFGANKYLLNEFVLCFTANIVKISIKMLAVKTLESFELVLLITLGVIFLS